MNKQLLDLILTYLSNPNIYNDIDSMKECLDKVKAISKDPLLSPCLADELKALFIHYSFGCITIGQLFNQVVAGIVYHNKG